MCVIIRDMTYVCHVYTLHDTNVYTLYPTSYTLMSYTSSGRVRRSCVNEVSVLENACDARACQQYTNIHTYIHTYIYTYIHTCVHTYVHRYTHVFYFAHIVLLPVASRDLSRVPRWRGMHTFARVTVGMRVPRHRLLCLRMSLIYQYVCHCVCACVRVRVRVCVCACACVREYICK